MGPRVRMLRLLPSGLLWLAVVACGKTGSNPDSDRGGTRGGATGGGGSGSDTGAGGAAGAEGEPLVCLAPLPADADPACPDGWSLARDSICGPNSCAEVRRCVMYCGGDEDCPRCLPKCSPLVGWEGDSCDLGGSARVVAEVCGFGVPECI